MKMIIEFFKNLFCKKSGVVKKEPYFAEVPEEHMCMFDELCLDVLDVPSTVSVDEAMETAYQTTPSEEQVEVPAAPKKKKRGRPRKKKKATAE